MNLRYFFKKNIFIFLIASYCASISYIGYGQTETDSLSMQLEKILNSCCNEPDSEPEAVDKAKKISNYYYGCNCYKQHYSKHIHVKTQKEVDALATICKPIHEECKQYNRADFMISCGNITIGDSDNVNSDITNLNSLKNLKEVNEMKIINCPQLQSLDGLENLKVMLYMSIINCKQFKNIDALNNLNGVSVSLTNRPLYEYIYVKNCPLPKKDLVLFKKRINKIMSEKQKNRTISVTKWKSLRSEMMKLRREHGVHIENSTIYKELLKQADLSLYPYPNHICFTPFEKVPTIIKALDLWKELHFCGFDLCSGLYKKRDDFFKANSELFDDENGYIHVQSVDDYIYVNKLLVEFSGYNIIDFSHSRDLFYIQSFGSLLDLEPLCK